MKLNRGLLELIIMVQDYKKYVASKNAYNQAHGLSELNWYHETEMFYYAIDKEILNKYGLLRNLASFEKVYNFVVTDEIMNTNYGELGKFIF